MIIVHYVKEMDKPIFTVIVKDKCFNLEHNAENFTMSLDDFSNRILKPILYSIADKFGYAT